MGNIETFLRRNYGKIHETNQDTALISEETKNKLKNENSRRPMSALRTFKVTKDKMYIDEKPKPRQISNDQLLEWGIDIEKILHSILKCTKLELDIFKKCFDKENHKIKLSFSKMKKSKSKANFKSSNHSHYL